MNKASGGDGISVELFQILKDGVWKCCTQYASKFGKLSSGHRTGKISFHFTPKESNAKECSNYCTIVLIPHASKVMLKILHARLQHYKYVNWELPDVQAGFIKGRGTRDQIANICWIIAKSREFQKNITRNKASGGDGIPVELFQILKDDAMKVLHSVCQQIWKTQQWPQDWKRSVFIPVPKKSNAKECSNYRTIALISHTSKVMLKILQARLQQYINWTSRYSSWI